MDNELEVEREWRINQELTLGGLLLRAAACRVGHHTHIVNLLYLYSIPETTFND